MSMTQQQFDEWIETEDGQSSFYEWLYDNFPEMNKHQLFDAMESGDYVESFMESMEVVE